MHSGNVDQRALSQEGSWGRWRYVQVFRSFPSVWSGEEMVKDLNLLASALRLNGAVTGGMGAIGTTTVSLTTDLLDGSNAAETIHTAAREAIAQNQLLTTKLFDASMLSLLKGEVGATKNYTLVEIVQEGRYVNTTEILPSYRDELHHKPDACQVCSEGKP